mmetsp:Transcript_2959/g.8104  ORF Transcript_2959/g.8104 Transcript_2959/m.8104 type:complete len:467 (-) Transcript_2959:296-1696(-)
MAQQIQPASCETLKQEIESELNHSSELDEKTMQIAVKKLANNKKFLGTKSDCGPGSACSGSWGSPAGSVPSAVVLLVLTGAGNSAPPRQHAKMQRTGRSVAPAAVSVHDVSGAGEGTGAATGAATGTGAATVQSPNANAKAAAAAASSSTEQQPNQQNEQDHPQKRMQLCVYEKGGTKNWKKLHCLHNFEHDKRNAKVPNNATLPDFNQCWNPQPPYDSDSNKSGEDSRDSGSGSRSARVVFLRDPLERFLSGFLDKCVLKHDAVDHCEPVSIFSSSGEQHAKPKSGMQSSLSSSSSSSSPIDSILWDKRRTFEAYVDTFPLTWNMHFLPQSFYCGGLYRTIDDYDFVGNMGDTLYRDLWKLNDRYPGLSHGLESAFRLSSKTLLRNANATDTKTARATSKSRSSSSGPSPAAPNAKGIETGAAEKVLEYYTPHTVRRVLEYYAIDYVTLGLPVPDWAEALLRSEP